MIVRTVEGHSSLRRAWLSTLSRRQRTGCEKYDYARVTGDTHRHVRMVLGRPPLRRLSERRRCTSGLSLCLALARHLSARLDKPRDRGGRRGQAPTFVPAPFLPNSCSTGPITGGHSIWDQILLLILTVKIAKYIPGEFFCVCRRSYLIWSPVIVGRFFPYIEHSIGRRFSDAKKPPIKMSHVLVLC